MKKIPTLFKRDPEDMRHVLAEVNPDCRWVLDGEGVPTRKYDGTCVMLDDAGRWWARREVKPGKTPPANYVPLSTDPATGKTMGWEPIEQSAFAKFHVEALHAPFGVIDMTPGGQLKTDHGMPIPVPGTYELVGPRVNGNPEGIDEHLLVRHGYTAVVDATEMETLPRDFDGLRGWLLAHPTWEGIVWHNQDGRMAKLKRRDFA